MRDDGVARTAPTAPLRSAVLHRGHAAQSPGAPSTDPYRRWGRPTGTSARPIASPHREDPPPRRPGRGCRCLARRPEPALYRLHHNGQDRPRHRARRRLTDVKVWGKSKALCNGVIDLERPLLASCTRAMIACGRSSCRQTTVGFTRLTFGPRLPSDAPTAHLRPPERTKALPAADNRASGCQRFDRCPDKPLTRQRPFPARKGPFTCIFLVQR
jgi:hypothetical protein